MNFQHRHLVAAHADAKTAALDLVSATAIKIQELFPFSAEELSLSHLYFDEAGFQPIIHIGSSLDQREIFS